MSRQRTIDLSRSSELGLFGWIAGISPGPRARRREFRRRAADNPSASLKFIDAKTEPKDKQRSDLKPKDGEKEEKKTESAKPDDKEKEKDKGKDKTSQSGKPMEKNGKVDFTADMDKQLQNMKAAGKSWKEISAAMDVSERQLKERFKAIGAAANSDAKDNTSDTKAKKQDADDDAEKKKDKSKGKRESSKRERRVVVLQEDDVFSVSDLEAIAEIMYDDEEARWLRIASRLYDRTGKRVHPFDIRDKVLGHDGHPD